MQAEVTWRGNSRLGVVVALLMLGAVLFRIVELPDRSWMLNPLGSPLEIVVSSDVLLVVLAVGLVSSGTNVILRSHPDMVVHSERLTFVWWILPALGAGFWTYVVTRLSSGPVWASGVLLLGLGTGAIVRAQYASVRVDAPGYPVARLALSVLAYLLAFGIFVTLYRSRARSLVSVNLALLASFLVSLDLLSVADASPRRRRVLAGTVALVVGEVTWALNYLNVTASQGGLILLLVFYLGVNLAHQYLLCRLSRGVVAEFVTVVAAVLATVLLKR
jgi:hypothetical protein